MKMISDGMVFRSFAADFTNMWSKARYWYYMFLASDQHRAVLQEHVDHLQQPGGALNPLVVEEEEAEEPEMEQEEPEAAEEVENPDVPAPPASPHHLAPNAPAVPPEFEQPEPHVGTPELAPLPPNLVDGPPVQPAPHVLPPPEPVQQQHVRSYQARMSVRREVYIEAAATRTFLNQVLGLQGGNDEGSSNDIAGSSSGPSDF
jgi:hypothetical protein